MQDLTLFAAAVVLDGTVALFSISIPTEDAARSVFETMTIESCSARLFVDVLSCADAARCRTLLRQGDVTAVADAFGIRHRYTVDNLPMRFKLRSRLQALNLCKILSCKPDSTVLTELAERYVTTVDTAREVLSVFPTSEAAFIRYASWNRVLLLVVSSQRFC